MIRISKLADYAVVILVEMARMDTRQSTSFFANRAGLSEPTVSKVLKILASKNIIQSSRGVHGGYQLLKVASDISIEEIICAIDGPISIVACTDGSEPDCSLSNVCSVRGRWDGVNTAIRQALNGVSLADMANDNKNDKEQLYGSN